MEQKHAGDGLQNVTFFIGKFSVFLSLQICFDGSHQKLVKNVQKQIHVCGLSLEMNVSVLLALFLAFPPPPQTIINTQTPQYRSSPVIKAAYYIPCVYTCREYQLLNTKFYIILHQVLSTYFLTLFLWFMLVQSIPYFSPSSC